MGLEIVKKVEGYLATPELRARLFALAERDQAKMERILTVAMKVVARDEKLQKCSIESIIQAVTDAVEIGLEPSGVTGEAYLIPRKGVACFQPSYRGKAKLAYENGWDLIVDVIYENDPHRILRGSDPKIEHEYHAGDRGEPLWFYVVATHMASGYRKSFPPMSVDEVKYIRDEWGYEEGDAWRKSFIEMGKKTALHRAEKLLPCSPKMNRARELDTQHFDDSETVRGRVVPANDKTTVPPPEDRAPTGANAAGSAAGEGGASTAPSPSPAPAPVAPQPAAPAKKKSKLSGAMERVGAAGVCANCANGHCAEHGTACADCIPQTPKTPFTPCVKHGASAVEKIDRPSERKPHDGVLEQEAKARGETPRPREEGKVGASADAEPERGVHAGGPPTAGGNLQPGNGDASRVQSKAEPVDPGPCDTDGCHRVNGHAGAHSNAPAPTDSAISDIVTAAANSGNPCKKIVGCILEAGHEKNPATQFCRSRYAGQTAPPAGLFAGKE